jgi:hypothetical protein
MHECLSVAALELTLPPPVAASDNSSCGELAFLALFPRIAQAAQASFTKAVEKGWTNRRNMEMALRAVGGEYKVLRCQLPTVGLALIEWTGTWRTEGFWGNELRRTHWVAVLDGFVYDANWSGWLPLSIWEEVVLHEVIAGIPGATGWQPHTGYEIL